MVMIPAGSFKMGVAPGEEAREEVPDKWRGNAEPRHRVTIGKSFAMGKYEVTRDEFAAFVRDSGHDASGECWYWDLSDGKAKRDGSRSWRDPGFSQTDNHPVTCVSWDDAKAYVGWLARKTGKDYHRPSESG